MREALDAMVVNSNTAMAVVTVARGRGTGGCLVGFHTQSSIDPWRYTVCLSKLNHTYELARRATHLGVHFLGQKDESLARLFGAITDDALRSGSKLDHVSWERGAAGETPILADVSDWFIGRILTRHHRDGDHGVFVLEPVCAAENSGKDRKDPYRLDQAMGVSPGHPVQPT